MGAAMQHSTFLLIAAAVLSLGLGSCVNGRLIASFNRSEAAQRIMFLLQPISPATSFVDDVIIVGKKLGYTVRYVDRAANETLFTHQTNWLCALSGKCVTTTVSTRLKTNSRQVDIFVDMTGNFNEVNPFVVAKVIADFETHLREQLAS